MCRYACFNWQGGMTNIKASEEGIAEEPCANCGARINFSAAEDPHLIRKRNQLPKLRKCPFRKDQFRVIAVPKEAASPGLSLQ